ncbi:Esterase [Lachnellula hyalina]|uniref:Esterase n=1 Tax=Lachnellula hyalina TaxID=1316788 RepID=A0A8H8QXI4_9HELO|nr:Esterase [Lachnellula hyalina]TVY23886.1 Esterase [Lachnellula hyalina]
MDISLFGLARNTLPRVPLILKTAILALFGWSPNSSVQDAVTEIIAVMARPTLGNPVSLLKSQQQTKIDYGIWGRMWVSKYTILSPEKKPNSHLGICEVQDALTKAIEALGDGSDHYTQPKAVNVEAEWTGYRGGVSHIARSPDISERDKYEQMMKEVEIDSPVILYLHGGAFCLMDPATHRWTTSGLAQQTRGRCLSVRYRLSPQYPFPSALLDCLIAYLALLCPPPGSFHEPISPSQIILAGDSSGAGLAASLLQILLTLPRIGISRIYFHDRHVDITVPLAGLAFTSPWLDLSRSLPSVTRNSRYDIIAPPSEDRTIPHPNFPPDSVWPTVPPRVETYCEATMVDHPLVSPLATHKYLWDGAPPVYLSVGWEGMQDEAEVFARRVYEAGGTVGFDGYEGMPHGFSMIPWNKAGRSAFTNWAAFCKQAVGGGIQRVDYGTWTNKHGVVRVVSLMDLGMRRQGGVQVRDEDLDDAKVDQYMAIQRDWRVKLEEQLRVECEVTTQTVRAQEVTRWTAARMRPREGRLATRNYL